MQAITQPVSPLALKEWAVAVKALGCGHQIITIRKGGLYEETREFRLEQPVEIPVDEAYKGCKSCKSWHHLLAAIPGQRFWPVLSDADYTRKREEIRSILHR